MDPVIQIGLWKATGAPCGGPSAPGGASSVDHRSASSSQVSFVSFKDLKDAWEVKSAASGGRAAHQDDTQKRDNRATSATPSRRRPDPSGGSPARPAGSFDARFSPKRGYANQMYHGRKRAGDSPSFDTTASSTASSGVPKAKGVGGGNRHRGRVRRGDLAREFDKAVGQGPITKAAGRTDEVDGGDTNHGSNGNNNNNINNRDDDITSRLLEELHSLMMEDDTTGGQHCDGRPGEQLSTIVQLSTVAEASHDVATLSTQRPPISSTESPQGRSPSAAPCPIAPPSPRTQSSSAPYLLAAQESPSPITTPTPPTPEDDGNGAAARKQGGSPRKTPPPKELSAFLTSPTGLHWEDLVRSMRGGAKNKDGPVSWVGKEIIVTEDDDVSELGSVVGGIGIGGGGYKGYVGDLNVMGDIVTYHRHPPPPQDQTVVTDERDVRELASGVDVGKAKEHTLSKRQNGSPRRRVEFQRNGQQRQRRSSSPPKRKSASPPRMKSPPRAKSSLRDTGPLPHRSSTSSRARSAPRESLEMKVKRVLSGEADARKGRRDGRVRGPPPPPSRGSKSSPGMAGKPKPPTRIGSNGSAFSPIKPLPKSLASATRSPNTPATSDMETTFDSSLDHCSPGKGPSILQKGSSSETTFVSIERPERPQWHQPFQPPVVTPQPMSPRGETRRRREGSSPQRQGQRPGRSGAFGRTVEDSPKDVHVSPRLGQSSSAAARRRAERLYRRDGLVSSSPCDDPPIVMNISTDDITEPGPPPTPSCRTAPAPQEEGPVDKASLYEALDTLSKNPDDGAAAAAISTATNYFRQNNILPSGRRQPRRESAEDPPLLPLASSTGEDSDGGDDDSEEGKEGAGANSNNDREDRVVQEDDCFFYQIRGMNPLFDAEDEDEDDAAAKVEDAAEGGGRAPSGAAVGVDGGGAATNEVPEKVDVDNNTSKTEGDGKKGDKDALPPGFDAAAAAAAAKQRVELQNSAVVGNSNPGGSGRFKKLNSVSTVSTSTNTASTSTATNSACTTLTAALCAGLWNGATSGNNTNSSGRSNRALPQVEPAVCILPESLSVNRKAPTCWQVFGHRLRRTKGEF